MKKSTFNLLTIASLFSLLTFVSCKDHDHHGDPIELSIAISAPIDAMEYEAGDTVFIRAKISASSNLHGYEVHLKRLADSTEIFAKDVDLHQNSFDINEFWINDGKIHSDMELEVEAIIDHTGASKSKTVKFHCHKI